MGLITDAERPNERYAILTDILGDEDHLGDMDFKVTGTADGITATQMDIKVDGLSYDVLEKALEQARQGRMHIMGEMMKTISEPREDYKPFVMSHETMTITVRRSADGKYQIISGERRFRACRIAGMERIPAYVRDTDDEGMLEMAIVENIQRTDLDPIEVALSYQRLMDECHLTQEQMAAKVGKKRASIANSLRLLKLPAKIQHDLKVGLITTGHAKVLLGVAEPEQQEALCDDIIRYDLSVRQLEERIRKGARKEVETASEENSVKELPEFYYRMLERVGRYFGDRISLKRTPDGKGSFTIRFNSDEEMEQFMNSLG